MIDRNVIYFKDMTYFARGEFLSGLILAIMTKDGKKVATATGHGE